MVTCCSEVIPKASRRSHSLLWGSSSPDGSPRLARVHLPGWGGGGGCAEGVAEAPLIPAPSLPKHHCQVFCNFLF